MGFDWIPLALLCAVLFLIARKTTKTVAAATGQPAESPVARAGIQIPWRNTNSATGTVRNGPVGSRTEESNYVDPEPAHDTLQTTNGRGDGRSLDHDS